MSYAQVLKSLPQIVQRLLCSKNVCDRAEGAGFLSFSSKPPMACGRSDVLLKASARADEAQFMPRSAYKTCPV